MLVNISVTKKKAVLSCVVKGTLHKKEVKDLLTEETFEVSIALDHLYQATKSLKTKNCDLVIDLVGSYYFENIIKGAKYLRTQVLNDFKKRDGSSIYMAEKWKKIFGHNTIARELLLNNKITFKHTYVSNVPSNFTGD